MKTHCVHGHEMTEDNTYLVPSTGRRRCRKCISSRPVQRRTARWRLSEERRQVLLALNLMQMQRVDSEHDGVRTEEIAQFCARSNRSVATSLTMMSTVGWVYSTPGDRVGWVLTAQGVDALERDREAVAA